VSGTRLKLSTKQSLFPPIEIEIDGTVYRSKKFTPGIIRSLEELTPAAIAGKVDAVIEQIQVLYPTIKAETLEDLDLRELMDLVEYTQKRIYEDQKAGAEKTKKPSGPGSSGPSGSRPNSPAKGQSGKSSKKTSGK